MGAYRIANHAKGIEVTQSASFPIFMGILSSAGGIICIYFWTRDLSQADNLDSFVVPLFGFAILAVGIWLLVKIPVRRCILLDAHSKQMKLTDVRALGRDSETVFHGGLETLFIRKSDNDGSWYTPTIMLDSGGAREIGFGCSSESEAQSVVDEITAKYAHRILKMDLNGN